MNLNHAEKHSMRGGNTLCIHRRVYRPVFTRENNSQGAARAQSHCALPAAETRSHLLSVKCKDFKCICQDWQEGGKRLQKS